MLPMADIGNYNTVGSNTVMMDANKADVITVESEDQTPASDATCHFLRIPVGK